MEDPNFFLEGILKNKDNTQDFEGPLSLILMLLSKNKIEIRDIKISDILDQYLEYLNRMQDMDLEIASDFIQMASNLLYIKTKTLLANGEEVSELELLMDSLEQLKCRDAYAAIQQVTEQLKSASEYGLLYYTKLPEPMPEELKKYGYRHEGVDLLNALYAVFSRGGKAPDMTVLDTSIPQRINYSVRDKSRQLLERLRREQCSLHELFHRCASKGEVVATFVSVLELCSMGSVSITRTEEDYIIAFIGGNIDEIIEKIVE